MRFIPPGWRRLVVGAAAASLVPVGAVAISSLAATPAFAAGRTLYVSHSATAGAADRSCSTAAYSSVQRAIDTASSHETVYLCGTAPYTESVVIQGKDLDLSGDPGATLQAPADAAAPTTFFSSQGLVTPNSVVTVIGNVKVDITGLTVEGPFQNTSCSGDDFGILQIGGGHLTLRNDRVLDIEAAKQSVLGGCQYGVAIQIGRRYWPQSTGGFRVVDFVGHARIQGTHISGYQKNGVTADAPGTTVDVVASSVDGGGPTPLIGRNGIQISRGATGQVHDSTISGNEYSGGSPDGAAAGVLVYGGCGDPLSTGVRVHNNTLHNNDVGVYLAEYDPTCSTAPSSRTGNKVHNNDITKSDGETSHSGFTSENDNSYTGYQVGIADTGNGDHIHNNDITGTVVSHGDTAYGPQTKPGGNFLAPIDIQTYPPTGSKVHNNTYDGNRTNPPY